MTELTWTRHRILLSRDERSVAQGGVVFFADGGVAFPPTLSFRRGAEIPSFKFSHGVAERRANSDILQITDFDGNRWWYAYQHDLYDKWYLLIPSRAVGPDEGPKEPTPARFVGLRRWWIAFVFGAAGDPPPNF
jgi:hypothetical protein